MNLEEYIDKHFNNNISSIPSWAARKAWDACKKEVLKIIEDEIDNGKMSIAAATKKIREEI
jgi:hypothetical protein